MIDSIKIYNIEYETCSKMKQKGAKIECRESWNSKEQQPKLNMKVSKLIFLHRTRSEKKTQSANLTKFLVQFAVHILTTMKFSLDSVDITFYALSEIAWHV